MVSNLDRAGRRATTTPSASAGVAERRDRRSRPRARTSASARRSTRSSPSRSARTRRSRRSSWPPRTSPATSAPAARLQLRLHEHASRGVADDAAADGDQPARGVRAAVRAAGHARRSARPRMQQDRSILDSITEDAERPAARPRRRATARGSSEYLDNVREIERRIQRTEAQNSTQVTTLDAPVGVPESFEEHVGADVRPAGGGLPGRPHARVHVHDGARSSAADLPEDRRHRAASHGVAPRQQAGEDGRSTPSSTPIHMQLFAKFLEKLQATPDGDGSLLDHSLIFYGSGMSNGNVAPPDPLPLVVVGGVRWARATGTSRRRRADAGRQPVGERGRQVRRRDRDAFGDSNGHGRISADGSGLSPRTSTCAGLGVRDAVVAIAWRRWRVQRGAPPATSALVDAVKAGDRDAVRDAARSSARTSNARRGRRHDGAALGRARRTTSRLVRLLLRAGANVERGEPLRRDAAVAGGRQRQRGDHRGAARGRRRREHRRCPRARRC